jgi:hypothetical protein
LSGIFEKIDIKRLNYRLLSWSCPMRRPLWFVPAKTRQAPGRQ